MPGKGHRIPFAARWPGHIKAGVESSKTICFTDMLATFAGLTGQALPANAGEDSFDLLPILVDKTPTGPVRENTVVVSSGGVLTIREGDWKLIPQLGGGGFTRPAKIQPKPGEPARWSDRYMRYRAPIRTSIVN